MTISLWARLMFADFMLNSGRREKVSFLGVALDPTRPPYPLQNASESFKMLQNASTSLNMLENASGRQEITIMYPFGRTTRIHCLGAEMIYW